MALTAVNINETRDYVSKLDPDKENPTVFQLGVLEPGVKAQIDDEVNSFEMSSDNPNEKARINMNMNKRQLMLIKFGLKGLKNLLDPQTGKEVEFRTNSIQYAGKMRPVVSDTTIAMIPSEIRKEIAEVIAQDNQLSEDEAKN